MARFRLGRAVSIRWNGLIFEGPALTVFEVPDEYNDELQAAMIVEPTFEWVEQDEGNTIRARLTALEGSTGVSLSNGTPVALGTAAPGAGTTASRFDHVHPTTGLSLTGHTHDTAGYTTIIKQYVKNDSTAKLKGEAVYISSADGTNPIVSYADADTEATSSKTLGLLEQNLSANQHGWVVTEGVLTNIDTGAATAGQTVWLSGTAGGRVYGAPPAEPAHGVYLGVVTKANASTGEIFVKVQNGYELDELHNVSAGSPSNGDIIQYNSSSQMWEKESLSTAGISATGHSHIQSDVTSLTTDLAGKAALSHTHAQSDVTSLTSALAGKSDTGHAHAGVYDPAGTAASTVSTHAAVTTSVHGITNTANLVYTSDSRLSDSRTPTAHASTHNAGGSDALAIDAVAATGSLRTLGTSATSAAAGNHGHTGMLTTSSTFASISTPTVTATTITSTNSASPTDITGMTYTFTPTYDEDVFVQQNLVITQSAAPSAQVDVVGKILVNGTAATPFSFSRFASGHSSPLGWTQGMSHTFVATSGTSYTVKTSAYKSAAQGTYAVSNGSTMSVLRVRA